jgi:GWxTD domain-containing protein
MKRIRRLLHYPEGPRTAFAPVLSATVLTLAAAGAMFAWQTPPASPYDKWVKEDVAYIISDQERAAFRSLTTDEEREHFIVQFWARRDPTPGTVENEYKEEHYRRIAYSNQRFADSKVPGWKTDRGRIYITYGPPDQLEAHAADPIPSEEWLYKWIEGMGNNVIVRFEDQERSGTYRQTVDPRTVRTVK